MIFFKSYEDLKYRMNSTIEQFLNVLDIDPSSPKTPDWLFLRINLKNICN